MGDDLASLALSRSSGVRLFPELRSTSLRGAPGLVADSLPGTFADLLTNAWLAGHGIQPGQISVVDRLGQTPTEPAPRSSICSTSRAPPVEPGRRRPSPSDPTTTFGRASTMHPLATRTGC